jgi:hypothetical protein
LKARGGPRRHWNDYEKILRLIQYSGVGCRRVEKKHAAGKNEGRLGRDDGAWKKWMVDREKSLVDKGRPLGKTKRVTAKGVSDVRNDLNWYVILEADSHEAAANMVANHPHLQIPGSSIEVMEIPDRPGM